MDSKLESLLNKINWNENRNVFENGKLEHIIANKTKTKYAFVIELPMHLDIDIYVSFIDKLRI